jgi:hypothetical protein
MSVEPTTRTPLRWSEVPITFSRADQWTSFSKPGRFPLVLDPVVICSRLTKVLINGGSGLNVLLAKTLKKMGLDVTDMLTKSTSPFYGIIPSNKVVPLGLLVLPVTLKRRENYRTEYIKFEVADFETSYHAILDRPALAKFMAIPHYVFVQDAKPQGSTRAAKRLEVILRPRHISHGVRRNYSSTQCHDGDLRYLQEACSKQTRDTQDD